MASSALQVAGRKNNLIFLAERLVEFSGKLHWLTTGGSGEDA